MSSKSLYFFQCGEAVKIGVSANPLKRLRALQTGHAAPITVLAILKDQGEKEKYCHERMAPLHLTGEWFKLSPDIHTLIKEVPSVSITRPTARVVQSGLHTLISQRTLKEIIDGSRYSIAEIASHLGVSTAMVYYWRDGTSLPPVPRFAKLCRYLGVPMEGVKIE